MGKCPVDCFFPSLDLGSVVHGVQETVHGRALDAFQVVSDTGMELKICIQAKLFGEQVHDDISADVFIPRTRDGQFGAPLDIIRLIACPDTGLLNTKLFAVQNLHGFQLKHTRARAESGNQVLRQLGMRASRRPNGAGQRTLGHRHLGIDRYIGHRNRIQFLFLAVFAQRMGQQFGKRNRSHDIAHCWVLLPASQNCSLFSL